MDLLEIRGNVVAPYLHGNGIEIGAMCNPMPVPQGVSVTYVDFQTEDVLDDGWKEVRWQKCVHVDVIDDGAKLFKFVNGSLDFVIASHVLEHFHDPANVLGVWKSKLKKDGVICVVLPSNDHADCKCRMPYVTPVSHLIADWRSEGRYSAGWHDVEAEEKRNFVGHWHQWTLESFVEMVRMIPVKLEVLEAVRVEGAPEFAVVMK